jgi:hypothetical protein
MGSEEDGSVKGEEVSDEREITPEHLPLHSDEEIVTTPLLPP